MVDPKEEEKRKKDEAKQIAKEQKKAEARARAEELKNDPVHKARSFAEKLNQDIAKAKALTTKMSGLDQAYVGPFLQAILLDQQEMDALYIDLQKAINEKSVDNMRDAMDKTNAMLALHQKRFRMAQGQVKEMQRMEREDEDAKSSVGSRRTPK